MTSFTRCWRSSRVRSFIRFHDVILMFDMKLLSFVHILFVVSPYPVDLVGHIGRNKAMQQYLVVESLCVPQGLLGIQTRQAQPHGEFGAYLFGRWREEFGIGLGIWDSIEHNLWWFIPKTCYFLAFHGFTLQWHTWYGILYHRHLNCVFSRFLCVKAPLYCSFIGETTRDRWIPQKGTARQKSFPCYHHFHDIIMISTCMYSTFIATILHYGFLCWLLLHTKVPSNL